MTVINSYSGKTWPLKGNDNLLHLADVVERQNIGKRRGFIGGDKEKYMINVTQ